jgi:hypothetical protein
MAPELPLLFGVTVCSTADLGHFVPPEQWLTSIVRVIRVTVEKGLPEERMNRHLCRATVIGALFVFLSAALPLFAQQEAPYSFGGAPESTGQGSVETDPVSNIRPNAWRNTRGLSTSVAGESCCVESGVIAELHLPDAPSATDRGTDQAAPETLSGPAPAGKHSNGAIPAMKGPRFDTRVVDWKYQAAVGSMIASTIVNTELTMRCVWDHYCDFVPPSMRRRAVLYGIYAPLDLGTAYYSYKLKKGGSRFWWVPTAVITGANTFVALHSLHRINNKGY